MMQHEGLVAELIVPMLDKFLDVQAILCDLGTDRWYMIHFIHATGPSVALVVNGATTMPRRTLCAT